MVLITQSRCKHLTWRERKGNNPLPLLPDRGHRPIPWTKKENRKAEVVPPRRDFCSSFSHFPLPSPSRCGARDWAQCLVRAGKGSCRFAAPSALGFILNQDLKRTDVLHLSATHRLTIQWEKKQWGFSGYKYFKNFLHVCVHVCVCPCVCVSVQKRPLCVCPSTEKVILSPLFWVLRTKSQASARAAS